MVRNTLIVLYGDKLYARLVTGVTGDPASSLVRQPLPTLHLSVQKAQKRDLVSHLLYFFETFKQEGIYLKQYQTFEEAQTNTGQFIEGVYNT